MNTGQHECKNCGASLERRSDGRIAVCMYCGSGESIPEDSGSGNKQANEALRAIHESKRQAAESERRARLDPLFKTTKYVDLAMLLDENAPDYAQNMADLQGAEIRAIRQSNVIGGTFLASLAFLVCVGTVGHLLSTRQNHGVQMSPPARQTFPGQIFPGKKAGCCAKAAKEGKNCPHLCCFEAAKKQKNCENCKGTNEEKKQ